MNTETISLNLESGERIAGVYLLQSQLETGGSPAIWLAEDEVLGKSVALHFLPPEAARDPQALAEIRLEVKRTRPLIHPNILRVYDLVEGDGWAAVATEAFSGRRLSALLEEHGRYEVEDLADWLDQVCVALEEAHRIRLTHRDVAAENIFVKPDGKLLLANFGIGRAVLNSLRRSGGLEADSARLSDTAPQLLEPSAATPADDVYGVGALFYRLISGEAVFSGGDVLSKIRETTPQSLSDVRLESNDQGAKIPPSWDHVIAACLSKSREDRPSSPAEIVASIEAYAPVEAAAPAPALVISEPEIEVPAPVEAKSTPEAVLEADISDVAEPVASPVQTTEIPIEEKMASAPEPVIVAGEPEIAPEGIEESLAETPAMPIEDRSEDKADEVASVVEPAPVAVSEPFLVEEDLKPIPAAEVPESVVAGPVATVQEPAVPAAVVPEPALAHRLYDTDEDAFSGILPKRFRFPVAVAAAVAVVLFLINGSSKKEVDAPQSARPIMASDTAEESELTTIKNAGREQPARDAEEAPAPAAALPIEPVTPVAASKPPEQPALLMAAGPAAKATAASASPAHSGASGDPIAEKSAALEKLKADLAAAEKVERARLQEQQAAEAAMADAQKAIDAKSQAAAAAKKEAQELIAARKQREDEQKSADLAARAAQQLAAEKIRAAEDAKKALADFETKNRTKLAAQDKVDGELRALQRTLEEQRKAADESARAAAAAAATRQQQLAAIDQTEKDLAAARAMAAKSAEEANRKMAVDSERKKLDDEIAAMRAMFEQKMKDIEDRRKQLEGGAPTAAAAPAALAPVAPAPRAPEPPRPAPTELALMASRTEPPPAAATPAPPAAPVAASGGATNSLGLRFVPVGDVQFATWLTRWKDFDAFARAVNLKSTAWRGPGFRQGPDHPVVNVTWNEAIAFCKWLTDKEHKEGALPANQFYRLPYDLEWSTAVGLPPENGKTAEARDMGVPDVYPWGTDWPPPKGAGNYTGEETGSDVAIKGYDDGFAWTSPVGSFPANKLGLYDMGGNVWQWCMDTWNADSKARVLRGASWYNGALKLSLLASCRVHAAPDSSTDNYGFRIVRATEAGSAKPARR